MAVQKKTRRGSGKPRISWAVLFWLAFIIFICGLFLVNREAINNSIQTIQNEMASRNIPPLPPPEEVAAPIEQTPSAPPPVTPSVTPPAPAPVVQPPDPVPAVERTPAQPPADTQAVQETIQLRERALYFTQVDRGGSILRVRVDRNLPVSNAPMTDVIQALITGPTEEERQRGLISLIPPGTRMLSATVRGNTAYLNFSEDFQFNTYGVEGYAAQLRQIVFTVTEFPNVRDVQILIDGRRIHYLGEGIWIGSPLNRDMF